MKNMLTIRTVTAYLNLKSSDFPIITKDDMMSLSSPSPLSSLLLSPLYHQVTKGAQLLRDMEQELVQAEYTVQTVRLATNPFGEWLYNSKEGEDIDNDDCISGIQTRLTVLNSLLANHGIEFCALGCATTPHEARVICPVIVAASGRFSCSAAVTSDDIASAQGAAETILTISQLGNSDSSSSSSSPSSSVPAHIQGGLGNFRFCAAASCRPYIPFFPAAKSDSLSSLTSKSTSPSSSGAEITQKREEDVIRFAVGFENGVLARTLLEKCQSIGKIKSDFCRDMTEAVLPVQTLCEKVAERYVVAADTTSPTVEFVGIDSSLNPSLEDAGSVAQAIEQLDEVQGSFGGPGTLAAAAEITKALQSLPGIKLTGYCGLMLPVCEDQRLATLATPGGGGPATTDGTGTHVPERELRITDLLSISSVCGVGVDTVPIPGDCRPEELTSLILDVAGIAGRWNKSLSCRVFPVPGKMAGEMTEFDSPYMVNSAIFALR